MFLDQIVDDVILHNYLFYELFCMANVLIFTFISNLQYIPFSPSTKYKFIKHIFFSPWQLWNEILWIILVWKNKADGLYYFHAFLKCYFYIYNAFTSLLLSLLSLQTNPQHSTLISFKFMVCFSINCYYTHMSILFTYVFLNTVFSVSTMSRVYIFSGLTIWYSKSLRTQENG